MVLTTGRLKSRNVSTNSDNNVETLVKIKDDINNDADTIKRNIERWINQAERVNWEQMNLRELI